jgi:hypothetical protein
MHNAVALFYPELQGGREHKGKKRTQREEENTKGSRENK